jgi:hypothetical protein
MSDKTQFCKECAALSAEITRLRSLMEWRPLHTQIIIEHDTVEALKSSALWKEIAALMFAEGPLSVIMIGVADDEEIANG